jgi:hypothetical protein
VNEHELRAMVRESIARALGGSADRPGESAAPLVFARHSSHYRYRLSDGPCLIEPAVQCNHCGFCQSHGH